MTKSKALEDRQRQRSSGLNLICGRLDAGDIGKKYSAFGLVFEVILLKKENQEEDILEEKSGRQRRRRTNTST